MLNVISLGAGRQSSAMALMAAHGLITPMPDAAVFADTGDEPAWVYETVRWLQSDNTLPFPVIITSNGRLSERLLAGDDMARTPFFVKGGGMATRQCSRNYKIRPIRREVRKLLGVGSRGFVRPGAVSQWIGISKDEYLRVKPNDVQFIINRWPLIELDLRVADCERWLTDNGYPVPWSSACVQCPYLSDAQRRHLKEHDPVGHERACEIDRQLRTPENVMRFQGELYVHHSRVPLAEADLGGPSQAHQLDMFMNECEGLCGV